LSYRPAMLQRMAESIPELLQSFEIPSHYFTPNRFLDELRPMLQTSRSFTISWEVGSFASLIGDNSRLKISHIWSNKVGLALEFTLNVVKLRLQPIIHYFSSKCT
jgi:hypothetical protein